MLVRSEIAVSVDRGDRNRNGDRKQARWAYSRSYMDSAQFIRALYTDLRKVIEGFPGFKINLPKSVIQREVVLSRR